MIRTISAKIFAHQYTGRVGPGVVFENSITVDVKIFENGTYEHSVVARRRFMDGNGKFVVVEFEMPRISIEEFQAAVNMIQGSTNFMVTDEDQSSDNLPAFMASFGVTLMNDMKERTYSIPFTEPVSEQLFAVTDLKALVAMSNREIVEQIVLSE